MLTLDPKRLASATVPLGTSWLLGACMEAKGKQDLWLRQQPEVLRVLREQSIIQSVESSNRIEGVTVDRHRLRPVVIDRVRPRDRSEEELAGYSRALDWIFSRKRPVTITPEVIKRLHSLAQATAADAGQWKARNNEIVEILPTGEARVRFIPTTARDTPKEMETLCRNYELACGEGKIPELITVATFVFDLLCIHPFRDGNGRAARLVTTLMLQSHGLEVCRYVSLERLIEESRSEYYEVLGRCSAGWHEGTNEIVPWWNYFLGLIRGAYREFGQQVESGPVVSAKSDLIRRAVRLQVEPFSLAGIAAELPAVSVPLIRKVLYAMRDEGAIRLVGRGRGARWERESSG